MHWYCNYCNLFIVSSFVHNYFNEIFCLGAETEENGQDDSNDGEDHECTDECGFCADDDGKKITK